MTDDATDGVSEGDGPLAATNRDAGDGTSRPADGEGTAASYANIDVPPGLLDDVEPADDVYLVRASLADGRGPGAARRLLDALDGRLTVVGSTLEQFDPADPRVDALVETDCERDALASALADLDAIDGVVVADVDALDPRTSEAKADAVPEADGRLAIYRLDDHLVVTDDVGAFVEQVADALPDEDSEARRVARSAREDLDALQSDLPEFIRWVDGRFEAVDDDVAAVEREVAALRRAVDDAADAETVAGLEARIERALAARDDLAATRADLEATRDDLDAVSEEVEAVRETAESAQAVAEDAVADSLTHLQARIDEDITTHDELERIFTPAASRVDDPEETHDTIYGVVEEMDRELRRSHALREAGLLGRLRWMLTGDLPRLPGEDAAADEDSAGDD